jgi:hypothetical protein
VASKARIAVAGKAPADSKAEQPHPAVSISSGLQPGRQTGF